MTLADALLAPDRHGGHRSRGETHALMSRPLLSHYVVFSTANLPGPGAMDRSRAKAHLLTKVCFGLDNARLDLTERQLNGDTGATPVEITLGGT